MIYRGAASSVMLIRNAHGDVVAVIAKSLLAGETFWRIMRLQPPIVVMTIVGRQQRLHGCSANRGIPRHEREEIPQSSIPKSAIIFSAIVINSTGAQPTMSFSSRLRSGGPH